MLLFPMKYIQPEEMRQEVVKKQHPWRVNENSAMRRETDREGDFREKDRMLKSDTEVSRKGV